MTTLAVAPPVPVSLPTEARPWDGAELASIPPGAWLAVALESGVAELSSADTLVEAVVAFRRLAAWATAGAAFAAAALSERPEMNPPWPAIAGNVSVTDVTGEELAFALGCSRRTARTLVSDGRLMGNALIPTGDALAAGDIDPVKARVLIDALADVALEAALDVQAAVLPQAPHRTPSQLANDVARALIVADAQSAEDRHDRAASTRRVNRPRRLPHGMAGIWAVLPAETAVQVDGLLDRIARSGRAAGDPRTLDQLRADVWVDLTLGRTEPTTRAAGTSAPANRDGSAGADRAPGNRGAAGDVRAEGPAPDGLAAFIAAGAPPADDAADPSVGRPTMRAQISVLVPLDVLTGASQAPADLAGYGPITASVARAIAADPSSTWRRIVTDPLTGAVLDVGRTRYRPPADLAAHVRARDRWCVRKGCSAPAQTCDLDHTVEWHRDDGTTCDVNLDAMCERDHLVKTSGGFRLQQVAPGVFVWTTPTGRVWVGRPGADRAFREVGRTSEDTPPPF